MAKKIIITEEQCVNYILERSLANIYDPYSNRIKAAKEALNNMLNMKGKLMVNIENGRDYLVYYAQGISDAIGKQYCICRVINVNKEPFGSIYIKPLELFKNKF